MLYRIKKCGRLSSVVYVRNKTGAGQSGHDDSNMTGCGTVTRSGEGEGGVMMISGIVFLMDNTLRRVTRSLDTRPREIESIPGGRPVAASGSP